MNLETTVVDLSNTFSQVFNWVRQLLSFIFRQLDSIYLFQGLSVLRLFIILVILGMIISAVFVLFDGSVDDD